MSLGDFRFYSKISHVGATNLSVWRFLFGKVLQNAVQIAIKRVKLVMSTSYNNS